MEGKKIMTQEEIKNSLTENGPYWRVGETSFYIQKEDPHLVFKIDTKNTIPVSAFSFSHGWFWAGSHQGHVLISEACETVRMAMHVDAHGPLYDRSGGHYLNVNFT